MSEEEPKREEIEITVQAQVSEKKPECKCCPKGHIYSYEWIPATDFLNDTIRTIMRKGNRYRKAKFKITIEERID